MRPLTPHLIDFLDAHRVGVLATVDKAAVPRQSVVYYVREEQRLLISTESKRFKARDIRRSGWASLCVLGHDRPYPSAVCSGPAETLTESIGPATAAIVHRIADLPEPPKAQSDEALAAIDRVILAITVEAVTSVNYLPTATDATAS